MEPGHVLLRASVLPAAFLRRDHSPLVPAGVDARRDEDQGGLLHSDLQEDPETLQFRPRERNIRWTSNEGTN